MSREWRGIGAFGVFVALLAVASAASTALAGSSLSDSTDAAAATSRWQRLSALDDGPERELTDVTWAVGRAWFVVGSAKNVTVASAHVRGGTLASISSTKLPSGGEWKPVLIGSDLAFSRGKSTTGISRLAGSGRASASVAATPEPLESTPGVVVQAATA